MKRITRNVLVTTVSLAILLVLFFSWITMEINPTISDNSNSMKISTISQMDGQQRQMLVQQVLSKKIFFAHMSVGDEVVDGLKKIGEKYPELKMNIMETDDPNKMISPGFYHTKLGFNTEPLKKVKSFQEKINKVRSAGIDIAFMKFCYVDITAPQNLDLIFSKYSQEFVQLQQQNPGTLFIHVTSPLTSDPVIFKNKIKEKIKLLTGKPTEDKNNFFRKVWNEKISNIYAQEKIFDLAKYESHTPDGHQVYKEISEQKVPVMLQSYTYDGGHLNREGRLRIAEQLLLFIASMKK